MGERTTAKERAGNKELIELELPLEAETDKAVLVDNDVNAFVWLPKSQLQDIKYEGAHVRFNCPRWLAVDRKLI